MKKNILYVCPSSGLGGAETFLKTTFSYHDKTQFSPTYLLFQQGPLSEWLKKNNADFEVLPQRPRLSRAHTIYSTHAFIQQFIKKKSIDLVHSTMAYGALFSSLATKNTKVPHVWFQHGPASGWMDQVAALLPHQGVLVNSDYTLQTQKKLEKPVTFFLNKHRFFEKIDLGTPAPQFSPEESKQFRQGILNCHHLAADTVIFSMACRLQRWKGVDLVIEAVQKMASQQSTTLPFFVIIYGDAFDSQEYVEQLKSSAKNLPVFFAGSAPNIPLVFSASDVVINASLQPEPFGLSIIEALSVARPVIAPNEGGPLEIIQDKKSGMLFTARSSQSLFEKMQWLVANPEQRNKMQQAALVRYQEHYTAQHMMQQLEAVYQKISVVN